MANLPYKVIDEGIKLHILVSPKAQRDEVKGSEVVCDDRKGEIELLRVSVRAIADKGLANKAVLKVISKWLNVPKSTVILLTGSKSRHKTVLIEGDGQNLMDEVNNLLSNL